MSETVRGAVARKEQGEGPVHLVWQKRGHFGAVLPAHIDVESFTGLAAGALYRDAKLMEAARTSPDSLLTALMRCAALGHQPGSEEFYLIPRKIKGRPTVQGIEGYRGIIERMYRSGAVASVEVREVCANDTFEYRPGEHDKPLHTIDWFGNRGEMLGVYAYAELTGGALSRVVVLSRADVMAAKASSDGAESPYSPWNRLDAGKDHPEFTGRSMWWKTAARRLEPWVPTSAEYRREQLRASAEAQQIELRERGDLPSEPVVDGEVVPEHDPETGEVTEQPKETE